MKDIRSFSDGELLKMGRRISELRIQNGFKGVQMAGFMNIHRSTYSDIECGKIKPSTDNLFKLCQIFDVSADYLLFGDTVDACVDEVKKLVKNNPTKSKKIIEGLKIILS